MTTPKEALQATYDLVTDCVPDDLVEKPEYLLQLKAAIPIAELHQEAWDTFVQILTDIHDYQHPIEENDADIKALAKKAFDYLLKMKALK